MSDPYFTLNRNEGVSTLHVAHPHEQCNIDDAEDVEKIDPWTAEALLTRGDAVACKHCEPRPVG